MQDPLLQLIPEQRASPGTARRPAPGCWNNLHDVHHECVAWLGTRNDNRSGQGMSLLLDFRDPRRRRGRTRHHDSDEIRGGSGDLPLP